MLCNPCVLGDPQTKGDDVRIGRLTSVFSGAQKSGLPSPLYHRTLPPPPPPHGTPCVRQLNRSMR